MYLTGFADEAAKDLATQIKATKEIGWSQISARGVNGSNIHELPQEEFEKVADQLDEAGITIPEFGSLIGNWGKKIDSDFDITLSEIDRAIPRMLRLQTRLVRIMSYAQEPWGNDQNEAERFRRLREIHARFADAGLQAIHENCMNWGGFSAEHTLRLIEEVPGLKLVFDTANPVFQKDRSKAEPFPWQDPLEFYQKVKEHVVHVHIKDCTNPPEGETEPAKYTLPGDGQAMVREILTELKNDGYTGGLAIEPHVATVFHAVDGAEPDWQQCYDSYVEYGHATNALLKELDWPTE
ncbi:sugar phosphate isomerase/epimerase [Akkermansiaceae bacterium]|nr:sugar phosphate isomerase/epimerase [bacterium]MDA7876672.1 sugar phosphate isomerase/epimerase [Akkermansiaceae bacterium]MDB4271367.1 sugar phosphate isomerase/epimerase [Akkermansiaceae bacterium]MDB4356993.1 sugar phosphate isomerase/epimerase [Akkermansiaceae bacterium]MDB4369232.1 sugar phosphate isomerase/epimerase [Akkermansiaceae bacterium]